MTDDRLTDRPCYGEMCRYSRAMPSSNNNGETLTGHTPGNHINYYYYYFCWIGGMA